jgi:alkaline phosphatase D
MPLGLRAFYEYNAIDDSGDGRLYRSVRWGKHLELFFLDNRRYRDPNRARDDSPKPKTQLGSAQVDWLEGALKASDATWRIVITSVPISVPTGTPEARDGWANADGATGYERELALLFATMHVRGIDNTIWLSTDVHFATGFEYTPFAEAPQFHLREFICGPLNAGIFPKQDLDPTFRPRRLFFYGPPKTPESYAEALSWFNFGVISIDGSGRLTVEIVNGLGATVASESFTR